MGVKLFAVRTWLWVAWILGLLRLVVVGGWEPRTGTLDSNLDDESSSEVAKASKLASGQAGAGRRNGAVRLTALGTAKTRILGSEL